VPRRDPGATGSTLRLMVASSQTCRRSASVFWNVPYPQEMYLSQVMRCHAECSPLVSMGMLKATRILDVRARSNRWENAWLRRIWRPQRLSTASDARSSASSQDCPCLSWGDW
jgi:hypothetical protein